MDSHGFAELSLAPWDRRIWDDSGSWFEAPTLRTVDTIAAGITAGIVSGGAGFSLIGTVAMSAAISTSSDVVFGALDVMSGNASFGNVATGIGTSFATNV